MLEHVLRKRDPHLGGMAEYLQKQIYDMRVISSEDLASFINITAILPKNIILSRQDVSPNLFFQKILTQFIACQGFPLFISTKYSDFLHFQRQCVH